MGEYTRRKGKRCVHVRQVANESRLCKSSPGIEDQGGNRTGSFVSSARFLTIGAYFDWTWTYKMDGGVKAWCVTC